MASRQPNYRLVKIHRNYVVEEIATLLIVHRNTVREWIKRGLPTTDSRRPLLIRGCDLAAFLLARRAKSKQPCRPGEIYCVRCRVPRAPAGGMTDYVPLAGTFGNLIGICPDCKCDDLSPRECGQTERGSRDSRRHDEGGAATHS
jgi:hypothetical protein